MAAGSHELDNLVLSSTEQRLSSNGSSPYPSTNFDIRWKPLAANLAVASSIRDDEPLLDVSERLHNTQGNQQSFPASAITENQDEADDGIAQRLKNASISIEIGEATSIPSTDKTWLPYGLRAIYLIILSIFAFAAAAVCIGLLIYSNSHYGLANDDGKASLLFGWRFTPTLIAVLYVLGVSIVLNDVKGTEAYARLSRPLPSRAEYTLCRVPGAWWDAYKDALSKKQNNKRVNWALLSAALVYTFGFLAISPLSASLLDSLTVTVSTATSFIQLSALRNGTLPFVTNQEVSLRTIGHQLQNLTTSAWITNDYYVMPFGPSDSQKIQFGPTVTEDPAQWHAFTTVFKVQMDCEEIGFVNITRHEDHNYQAAYKLWSNKTWHSLAMSDKNGCDLAFGDSQYTTEYELGVGSWFSAPNYIPAMWSGAAPVNISALCTDREVIFAINSWPPRQAGNADVGNVTIRPSSGPFMVGHVCRSQFYMANVSVTLTTTSRKESIVTVDEDQFLRNRMMIPSSVFDTSLFQKTMMAANWSSFLYKSGSNGKTSSTGGPLRLLAATYNNDMMRMVTDPNLTTTANKMKQRLLGETLAATFAQSSNNQYTNIVGETRTDEQRIVVNAGVAIALTVLLLLSGILILLLLFVTRISKRPLNLDRDPSSLANFTTLLLHDNLTRKIFRDTGKVSGKELVSMLSDTRHQLTEDGLCSIGQSNVIPLTQKMKDWRPLAIKRRNGCGLLSYLLILTSGIAAFWAIYERSGLHGSVFLYQARVSFQSSTYRFAPYSMVPTLLAVLVGLWWGDIEQTFRRIQPYVEMAKGSTSMSRGPQLSYMSTYLMWGAAKAISNRHWTLGLLFTGATLTQILTVSMSAIWQKRLGLVYETVTLKPQFEFRTNPIMTHFVANPEGANFNIPGLTLAALYSTLNTNWMYSATLQLVYNASEPAWSKDGWSFTPIDLHTIDNSSSVVDGTNLGSLTDQRLVSDIPVINVTLKTSALHARLDCNPYEGLSNISTWLTKWDVTNTTQWNTSVNPTDSNTGYELGFFGRVGNEGYDSWLNQMELISGGKRYRIPFFANGSPLQCCPNNDVDLAGVTDIGYWSYQSYVERRLNQNYYNGRSSTQGTNITTKWIHGSSQLYKKNSNFNDNGFYSVDHLIWRDMPQLTTLNCQPIIEFADAEITIDRNSEMVQDFRVLSPPKIIEHDAWDSSYRFVNYTSGDPIDRPANWATSYGVLFEDALMSASDLYDLSGASTAGYGSIEPQMDRTFNFRRPGLNTDFMSFSMYNMAAQSLETLLSPSLQARLASTVFSTFFQHFVSSNVTSNGSWVYVPIGSQTVVDKHLRNYSHSAYTSYDTITATVSRRVEILEMSLVATCLCLGILSFLVITAIVIYVFDYKHFDRLRHDTNSLADVIGLVCDSPKFLAWVKQTLERQTITNNQPPVRTRNNKYTGWKRFWKHTWYTSLLPKPERRDEPKVRLGTFIGTDEKRKWIVEIED